MSTDLVPSAADLADEILRQGRLAIDARIDAKIAEAREKMINEHYYKRAEALIKQLWSECKQRTGHNYVVDPKDAHAASFRSDKKPFTCTVCGRPTGWNQSGREQRGITKIAASLREADQAAGIEYIPNS